MSGIVQNRMSEYQLRQAAGKYWLLHMTQQGMPYERPVQLNSMGAKMWRLFSEGKTAEQVTELLMQEYGIEAEELKADVGMFCLQLKQQGIMIGE